MELKDYIKEGILRKGSVSALAAEIGIAANSVSDAKAHRRELPIEAAAKLSLIINMPLEEVIRASRLATARNPAIREFWLNFAQPAKAARVAGIGGFLAVVTNFVTQNAPDSPILRASGDIARQAFFVLCSIGENLYVRWNFCKST